MSWSTKRVYNECYKSVSSGRIFYCRDKTRTKIQKFVYVCQIHLASRQARDPESTLAAHRIQKYFTFYPTKTAKSAQLHPH